VGLHDGSVPAARSRTLVDANLVPRWNVKRVGRSKRPLPAEPGNPMKMQAAQTPC